MVSELATKTAAIMASIKTHPHFGDLYLAASFFDGSAAGMDD